MLDVSHNLHDVLAHPVHLALLPASVRALRHDDPGDDQLLLRQVHVRVLCLRVRHADIAQLARVRTKEQLDIEDAGQCCSVDSR